MQATPTTPTTFATPHSPIPQSHHARRAAQRNLTPTDVEYILTC